MAQPQTFLVDTLPNEQTWPWRQPIYWTLNRTYAFNQEVSAVATNKALFYKSLDGGVTWTKPDMAHATTVNGESDYYFDGASSTVNLLLVALSSGSQPLILQNFDFNTETYSATFGATGAPTGVLQDICRIARTADGAIICFYHVFESGLHQRAKVAIFQGGTWISNQDISPEIPTGNHPALETFWVDPANELVHFIYTNGGLSWNYRYITSAGVLGPVTQLQSSFPLHLGNLNHGRAFGTGYILTPDSHVYHDSLHAPVLTRNLSAIFSINFLDVTFTVPSVVDAAGTNQIGSLDIGAGWIGNGDASTLTPSFTLSAAIDTASSSTLGQDPEPGVAYIFGGNIFFAYFMGDGTNLYNLVKQAVFAGGVWSFHTVYDATLDPNAGKNTGNNQWINALSDAPDPGGMMQFQLATWLTLAGEPGQNTATLSTKFVPAVVHQPVNIGFPFSFSGFGFVNPITLPDPKLCKTAAQMKPQFQTDFELPNLPRYRRIK